MITVVGVEQVAQELTGVPKLVFTEMDISVEIMPSETLESIKRLPAIIMYPASRKNRPMVGTHLDTPTNIVAFAKRTAVIAEFRSVTSGNFQDTLHTPRKGAPVTNPRILKLRADIVGAVMTASSR